MSKLGGDTTCCAASAHLRCDRIITIMLLRHYYFQLKGSHARSLISTPQRCPKLHICLGEKKPIEPTAHFKSALARPTISTARQPYRATARFRFIVLKTFSLVVRDRLWRSRPTTHQSSIARQCLVWSTISTPRRFQRADHLQTARTNAQYASLLVAETAASGTLMWVSLDPKNWSQGDDKLAAEINLKALAAMGYSTTNVAQIASRTLDPFERARLFAVAASIANEPSQRLVWIGDIARSSYEAGQFQDAIRNSAYVAATVETALPSNDPKKVGLQKAANEIEGWSYLRYGDIAKFNELVSSYSTKYAVTKSEFKEPASRLPNDIDARFLGWKASPNVFDLPLANR